MSLTLYDRERRAIGSGGSPPYARYYEMYAEAAPPLTHQIRVFELRLGKEELLYREVEPRLYRDDIECSETTQNRDRSTPEGAPAPGSLTPIRTEAGAGSLDAGFTVASARGTAPQ